ncbi:MAG: alpha/beta hydrolase [Pseudomonadota bacterium]
MRIMIYACALLAGIWAIWVLEGARAGLTISEVKVGQTPVTVMQGPVSGPSILIAHGFAGSRQMMQGYGHVLARAGYTVYTFDFEGHGRHPVPMSGDVTAVDGTTRLLMEQTFAVMDFGVSASISLEKAETRTTGPAPLAEFATRTKTSVAIE